VVSLAKRTSIQIYEETKKELTKVIGELQAQDGNKRSYDEAILELVKVWRKDHSS
jgi:hypothetical protein